MEPHNASGNGLKPVIRNDNTSRATCLVRTARIPMSGLGAPPLHSTNQVYLETGQTGDWNWNCARRGELGEKQKLGKQKAEIGRWRSADYGTTRGKAETLKWA